MALSVRTQLNLSNMLFLPQGDDCTTAAVNITKYGPNTQKTQRSGATINSESTTREPQLTQPIVEFLINFTGHIFALDASVVIRHRIILARMEAVLLMQLSSQRNDQ